ncbi:MAG: hypothetical protein AB1646_11410 [Thermodesulfobacteriota bacterium]
MMQKPTITISHELPGRLRLRLSHKIKNPEQTVAKVKTLPGVLSADYTTISRSFLVRFDSSLLSREKVIIRVALCLSLDYGKAPVRIVVEPEVREWSDSPFYSALALMAALAARIVRLDDKTTPVLDWVAGFSTAGAVLHHGWLELRRHGYYDPEVLSVVYLATAFLRGQFLRASLVTWFTTFGRHILKPPPRGVELRITHAGDDSHGLSRYGIIVAADRNDGKATKFSRFVPAVIQYALMGGTGSEDGIWLSDIRDLVTIQDDVLQELGQVRDTMPVPLRIAGAS